MPSSLTSRICTTGDTPFFVGEKNQAASQVTRLQSAISEAKKKIVFPFRARAGQGEQPRAGRAGETLVPAEGAVYAGAPDRNIEGKSSREPGPSGARRR